MSKGVGFSVLVSKRVWVHVLVDPNRWLMTWESPRRFKFQGTEIGSSVITYWGGSLVLKRTKTVVSSPDIFFDSQARVTMATNEELC